MINPDRIGPDPTEGWRRGSRGALRKSCDACTASKTKCQGSIPCDRCKKRGIECKFSKRRRCGPKARAEDEKRPRLSMDPHPGHTSSDSPERSGVHHQPGTPHPPSPSLPPVGTIGGLDSTSGSIGSGLPGSPPKLSYPTSSDGLSGLGELVAPTLSDAGGSSSGSSAISASINAAISSSCHGGGEAAYSHHVVPSGNRYTPLPAMNADGVSPFLEGGGTSPPHHYRYSTGTRGTKIRPGLTASSVAAVATLSGLSTATDHDTMQGGDTRGGLTPSRSAPIGTTRASILPYPPRDLPTRAKSLGDTPGVIGGFEEAGGGGGGQAGFVLEGTGMPGSMGSKFMGVDSGEGGQHTPVPPRLPPRGPLPMSLEPRSKAHLETFLRSVGSLVLLPGADAIRDAVFGDGSDSEGVPDAGGAKDGGESSGAQEGRTPVGAAGGDGTVDAFVEACRAEVWAATAVGALFNGAQEDEGMEYVSRALQAMSRWLDAPFPEVVAVMILLVLFWMHFMDTRKVARYFGFAQQVGLELGTLMPEGLRHTLAFVASLVTMTLNLDQAGSYSLQVKHHAVWGVSLPNTSSRPGVDPFVLAITALTVACNEMLHDAADSAGRGGIGPDGLSRRVRPSKVLTDLLAKALRKASMHDGNKNPEHVLALLHGLKGYTHAARGEIEEAEASGSQMLAIVDRHAAVLHLPLTFTLAEGSRRLLRAAAERSSRPVPPGVHAEALRAARATLRFAQPRQPGEGVVAGTRGGGGGGWCAFGDEILAAFDRADSGDRGDLASEATDDRERSRAMPSRSGSMSPPPQRTIRRLPRAVIASQKWQPTTGGGNIPIPGRGGPGSSHTPSTGLEAASPSSLPRWEVPSTALVAVSPATKVGRSSSSSASTHRSVLLGSNGAAPSDWVDRVRKLPTISLPRSSSPSIVDRAPGGGGGGARTPSPRPEGAGTSAGSLSMLSPGQIPTAPKYASEQPNLALLSTVAAPGGYHSPSRRASFGDRSGVERQHAGRQRLTGQTGGAGGAIGAGVDGESDRDGEDLPPPVNPGLTTGMSFDPNRDDGTFPFTLGSS